MRPRAWTKNEHEEQQDRQTHRGCSCSSPRRRIRWLGGLRCVVMLEARHVTLLLHRDHRGIAATSHMVASRDHQVVHAHEADDKRADNGDPREDVSAGHTPSVTRDRG